VTITTYAELQTAVANWLKRSDLTSYIPDLISLAEAQMNRDFANFNPPLRAMEQTQTGTLSGSTLALPSRYMGTKRLRVSIGGQWRVMEVKSSEQLGPYTTTGEPVFISANGENLEFGPPPGTSYSYEWIYWQGFAALSAGVNWVITNAPDLYLFGTLLQAEPFIKNDKRIPIWAGFYKNAIQSLEMANRKDRMSGSTLRMRTDAATP
jgi:hypothetical protein